MVWKLPTSDKDMRIGIYTQPLRVNYGGLLQAWALQTILKRMGHDVVTFDPNPYIIMPWKRKMHVYGKRLLKRVCGKRECIRKERVFNKEQDVKMINIKPFIEANINRKEFIYAHDINPDDFDVMIVGSDQVWRPKYNYYYRRTIENSFLDFARFSKVKRIAYAASFGTDDWEFTDEQSKRCGELIKLFSAISVREHSAIRLCEEHFGVSAAHVLDPTMLLERKDYENLIAKGNNTNISPGNLLCYILDETEQTSELIEKIATQKKLTPYRANSKVEDKKAPISEKIQPPVEQWLRNFKEAEFVVTDSFHACVFSIIFAKPFVVIGNRKRGMSRYESLLSEFGMEPHLIYSPDEFVSTNDYTINEEKYRKLDELREKSLNFLNHSLCE